MTRPADILGIYFRCGVGDIGDKPGHIRVQAELARIDGYCPEDDPGLDQQGWVTFHAPASVLDQDNPLETLVVLLSRATLRQGIANERQQVHYQRIEDAFDVLNQMTGSQVRTDKRHLSMELENGQRVKGVWPWAEPVTIAALAERADALEAAIVKRQALNAISQESSGAIPSDHEPKKPKL